jgi:hypothetical protein
MTVKEIDLSLSWAVGWCRFHKLIKITGERKGIGRSARVDADK